MENIKYTIANNVKLYRKKENLTQFELAERAELSIDSVKRIEGGKSSMSLDNFLRLAEALGVPLSWLLYENVAEQAEADVIWEILNGRNAGQKEYLIHMLCEMAKGLDGLS